MERRLLTETEIGSALGSLDGWSYGDDSLTRRFEFTNFADALAFVNRVGDIAETADHHPDIKLGWGYAEIATTTHDRSGVTDVDLALANRINGL